MIYAWSDLWLVAVGAAAVTLLPISAMCCTLAAARPMARPVLDACAFVMNAGALATAAVGIVTSARSVVSMQAAAALVDPSTARALWEQGWPGAVLPASTALAVGSAIVVTMRAAQALDGRHPRPRAAVRVRGR